MQPWMICSMPHTACNSESAEAAARKMRHLSSTGAPRQDVRALWHGTTMWGYEDEESGTMCAVGWDWVELQPQVIALMDPMAITTNMRFDGMKGPWNDANRQLLVLNMIVFHLPWQDRLMRELSEGHDVGHFRCDDRIDSVVAPLRSLSVPADEQLLAA